ncbi:MAG: hypothetical protein KAR38_04200, partial [Calditrichia bacterium]|nr:hypothetical protein [Calditrichia bacterium]
MLKKSNLSEKPEYSLINIGNWQYWQKSDGISSIDPYGISGGIFPKNTGCVIFQDGFLWGGYVQDNNPAKPSLRVGGQKWRTGTQPGWIKIPGNGIDPPVAVSQDNDSVRIYRVRSDIFSIDHYDRYTLLPDAQDIYGNDHPDTLVKKIKAQYIKDWQEWPGNLGAPYYDRNRNGKWDPDYDEPGIAGSDQTIWYAVNDLNETRTDEFSGSPPIGLELQITIWAYKYHTGALGNTIFKRYRVINKSGYAIDSMYIGQWSDPDIGHYGDDFVGCDSILGYGFSYNGYPSDIDFEVYNLKPPAVGYVLLQGPVVPEVGDTAIVNFKKVVDYKNIPMSSFYYFSSGMLINFYWEGYDYTLIYYNLLRGYIPTNNVENPSPYWHGSGPFAGNPTKYPLNGDPVAGIGDIDGEGSNYAMSDRRMGINSGPFSMEPDDVQEIVIALVGANSGSDGGNIASLAKLQRYVPLLKGFYNDLLNFIAPEGPIADTISEFDDLPEGINLFILGENYPNPFNNTTNIRFVLYDKMKVDLVIFN